ncbi:carbohydrate ABC transporter permease [Devosia ginsengisoli]|uniref:carbohydrate ABC transporter permease n=1 Tax=Devosia ginsengisoli TaxID=400770 RepID=UPI0026EBE46F|nr:sugar ABC transporter permease [Devosia ginsengisoli]MCR6671290.1 sugar ABC transporter permease [Devosia ginsengisoli]
MAEAGVATVVGTGGRRSKLFRVGEVKPYLFVLPFIGLEALFLLLPLGMSLYYSLFDIKYLIVGDFVGLQNYFEIFSNRRFLASVGVTMTFSLFSLFFTFIVGFALALWLVKDNGHSVFMRAIILVPYVISMLVGSLLLKWVLSQDAGLTDLLLGPLGIPSLSILGDPSTAMAAIVYNGVWRDSAFAMMLLMAGLKSIPLHIYQAAKVDGASKLYTFWRITLPLMRMPILITLVRLLLYFVNSLTFQLVLTGGGPAGATTNIVLHMYRSAFEDSLLGLGNAMSFVLFLFNLAIIAVIIILFRVSGRTPK